MLAPWAVAALLICPSAGATERMLDCKATIGQPQLDFEFRFFAGYRIRIPAREMIGPQRLIVLQLTVTPLDREGAEAVRMRRSESAGPIPDTAKNEIVEVTGSFVVGEGRYSVFWQMYDSLGAYCELQWNLEAKRGRGERDLRLLIGPGEVADSRVHLFRPLTTDPAADVEKPLDLKVFLNLDPWHGRHMRAGIRLFEFVPRLATLRALARHPRVSRISLVAYSVEEQTVYGRSSLSDKVDLSAIESAVEGLSPAVVSIEQLGKQKPLEFFVRTLVDELPGDEPVDAYVFVGPDAEFGARLPREKVRAIPPLEAPVFMLHIRRAPWRGIVGDFVSEAGGKEYRFHTPKTLGEAVDDLFSRIP